MLPVAVTVAVTCCVIEVDRESVGRFERDARVRVSDCVTDMLREMEYVTEPNSVCVSDEDRTVAETSEVVERVGECRVSVTDPSDVSDDVIVCVMEKVLDTTPRVCVVVALSVSLIVPETLSVSE